MSQAVIVVLLINSLLSWHSSEASPHVHSLGAGSTPVVSRLQRTGTTKNFIKPVGSSRVHPQVSRDNVSTVQLQRLSEDLFNKDVNNAWRYIKINLQNRTSTNSSVDRAPGPLLTVNPEAFQLPTINCILKMYDNYHLDTRTPEDVTAVHEEERHRLLDAFLGTEVMATAMQFLSDNNYLSRNESIYREALTNLWFSPYARGGGHSSSSGFEHVFLNELRRGRHVLGLHNWIYFNAMEEKRQANYLGYLRKIDLGEKAALLAFHFTFASHDKPMTSMFIGTSPELEMALYTVCFYVRRGRKCKLSLGGSKFKIITYQLTFKGRNPPVIGSAYPLM